MIQSTMPEADLRADPRAASRTAPQQDVLAEENVSLRLLLAQAEIEVVEPLPIEFSQATPTIVSPSEAMQWLNAHHIQPFYAGLLARAVGVTATMTMDGDTVVVAAQ